MKKRILAAALSLVLALSLLPGTTWAAEGAPGSSPENPIEATLQNGGLEYEKSDTFENTLTITGISEEWLTDQGASEDYPIYVTIDFDNNALNSCGYSYAEIGKAAFQQGEQLLYYLVGATLAENTRYIGSYAFEGCTSLEYIYESENKNDRKEYVKFELPGQLFEIGERAFSNCFAPNVSTAVKISGTVSNIGAYAFYNDELDYLPIAEIVVRARGVSSFDTHCFDLIEVEGYGPPLIIFNDFSAYQTAIEGDAWTSAPAIFLQLKDISTYPVKVRFENENGGKVSETNCLYERSLLYYEDDDYWFLRTESQLPQLPETEDVPEGYEYGWLTKNGNEILTDTSIITSSMQDRNHGVTASPAIVLMKPEIAVTVDGKPAVSTDNGTHYKVEVTLTEGEEHSVGLQISHPLLGATDGESVTFRYRWWDEQNSSPYGDRTDEAGFFDAEPARVESEIADTTVTGTGTQDVTTETISIPITSTDHTRTGGNYYMVEVFGYHNENGGSELYYKSHRNFISFITDEDVLATVPTVYIIEVTVKEAPVYSIATDKKALDFGTVDTGYTPPAAQMVTITNTGNQSVTIQLPALDGYMITAGEGWEDNSITLAPNVDATFTVQPVAGLAAGTYDETLTVSGTNSTAATVALSLTVRSSTGGGGGSGTTRYTITTEAGRGGSISPSGRVSVSRGDDQTFRITASDDYEIADVLVDGDSVGAVSRYTFENVRANHTIEVVFEAAQLVADPDDTGVSGWLNTTDHMAYLNGFTDGSFGPDRQMTRGQAAQMFYNLLLVTDVPVTTAFTDVPDDMWCATAVNTLASLGIIQGFSDGTFRPDQNITRAQFAVIAMRFTNETPAGTIRFSDVDEDDWFYTQVTGAAQYGWIGGFSDGTFRPYDSITRAQVTAIVNRMLGRSADTAYVDRHVDELRQFSDVEETYWAYYLIMEATNDHNYSKDAGTESWTGLL